MAAAVPCIVVLADYSYNSYRPYAAFAVNPAVWQDPAEKNVEQMLPSA